MSAKRPILLLIFYLMSIVGILFHFRRTNDRVDLVGLLAFVVMALNYTREIVVIQARRRRISQSLARWTIA